MELHPTATDPFPPGNWPQVCPGCEEARFPVMDGWAAYRAAVVYHRDEECVMFRAMMMAPSGP